MVVVVFAAALCSVPASAQAPGSPAAAVDVRRQGMKAIGAANKGLADGIVRKGKMEDLRPFAARLNELAVRSGAWFPRGSGPESGSKTKAAAEIWAKPDEFKNHRDGFIRETAKLAALSKGDDLDAVKGQFAVVRRACKSCHDAFTTD